MKSITIDPELSDDPEIRPLIKSANAIIDRELGASSSRVDATWLRPSDSTGSPQFEVLSDMLGTQPPKMKGESVSLAELGPHCDVARLIGLKAIGPAIGLTIRDQEGNTASVVLPRRDLQDADRAAARFVRLWGDILQERSHKKRERLSQIPERPAGEDVIDMISDAIYEYTEKHGDEPHVLKLPIRYAVALMKLGPTFWGDLFQQIRESGVRALENQKLLGASVRLVNGVGAELEVE